MPDITVVTYQGGSAGDMFAAGANGIHVDFVQRQCVYKPPWSIKIHEPGVENGSKDLIEIIYGCGFDFVTTHIYQALAKTPLAVISIMIADPSVIERTILRQMKLQMLTIKVNPNETAYRLIKSLVDRQCWHTAAKTWFAMAHKQWMKDLRHRTNSPLPGCTILNFDRLYHKDFVDSLWKQGFTTNLDLIRLNHQHWLHENLDHTLDGTLQSMAYKLQHMDWTGSDRIAYD